jgi:hypothetical protein
MPAPEALGLGVERFNRQEFFEAHEEWETIWLAHRGPAREYLKGLIQLAAALHHHRRGNSRGAARLFASASQRIERFPEGFCGVLASEAVAAAGEILLRSEPPSEWPRLELSADWRTAAGILETSTLSPLP